MIRKIVKSSLYHPENQYLNLIHNTIKYGIKTEGRNGTTRSLIGETMKFDLTNNTLPLITSKKLAWKTCLKELFWFMRGETNNKILKEQKVNIWNQNASREFLDSRGLYHLKENDLGPVYGHQWRYYNAPYKTSDDEYINKGIDQLTNVVNMLKDKETRNSRRIILNAWNPEQIDEMALPPCHVLSQFIVKDNKLTTLLYQRSGDIGLGIPFNIASYSFLTHILAKHCNLEAKEFIHFIGDAHIYEEHIGPLKEQLNNTLYEFPKIEVKCKYEDINDYKLEDIVVNNYKFSKKIKMEMKS
tara:strand:- start:2654 stop:3553 length:900 start_codon:yes stop_codon:yes gene_type:complete